jgi:tetratricopeptide (TPR) repeat protein
VSAQSRAQRIESLFFSVLEQPRELRAGVLLRECGGDEILKSEVQRLLDADDSGSELLETPAYAPIGREPLVVTLAGGQRIGGFQIVRLIGSGGMGDVYEAVQDQPQRVVALKILRAGAATRDAVRRFQSEADVLARLSHPGIAQVFAVGVHEDGLFAAPYFAMEFVADAVDLMQFARERGLDLKQRVTLFLEVCAAVQHGHQRGVIHRDLKPGNILVGNVGSPKVIDFGIAKAQDAGLRTTFATDLGQLVGTLQYMSPEQLRGDTAEIDIRSDVYSLGLILYELLADRRPYDLSRLSLPEVALRLQQAEPPPLGTLRRELRGDLATIVAKSIEKDSSQRYQSVGELSADLERFLGDEPIVARPPSAAYVLRKFARRNRALTAAALISAAAIIAGAAVAGWMAVEATRERNAARSATRRAERINHFLMRVLSAADPKNSSADVTIRQALDSAAASIAPELADDLQVAGDVRHLIASIYERLGMHQRAEEQMRMALETRRRSGRPDDGLADTLRDLAWVVVHRDPDEAERLFIESGSVHFAVHGPDETEPIRTQINVSVVRMSQKRFAEAESLLRESLAALERIGKIRGLLAMLAHRTLAMSLYRQQRYVEAEPHFRQALELVREVYGNEDLVVSATLCMFAGFLEDTGKPAEAAELRNEAECIQHKLLGTAGVSPEK